MWPSPPPPVRTLDANSPDIDLAVTIHIFGEFLSCFCELIKVPGSEEPVE